MRRTYTLALPPALFAAGVCAFFSATVMPPIDVIGPHQIAVYSLIAVGAAAITMSALNEPFLGFLKTRTLRYLGKISYGLYVFHLLSITVGMKLTKAMLGSAATSTSWWLAALFSLTVTMALGAVSYQVFERKFLNLKRRFEAFGRDPPDRAAV